MPYILCVDDEEAIAFLVGQILLAAGHEAETAGDGLTALEKIAAREPDLIVLDWSMPHLDGLGVCRAVKDNPFTSRIPILMLTAFSTVDNKVAGFEAGADDYLQKPFEPRELSARVAALLRLVQREGERNPSSGLPGGRAVSAAIEARVRQGEPFAVCYFDLDHFKPFADTFGFAAADAVISGFGALLGEIARKSGDFAGHIGGDDFLTVCELGQAQNVARECAAGFQTLVCEIVGREAAADGHFSGLDRTGTLRQLPLGGLSCVILPIDPENWVSVTHLGEAAANWKKGAKAQGAGTIVTAAG